VPEVLDRLNALAEAAGGTPLDHAVTMICSYSKSLRTAREALDAVREAALPPLPLPLPEIPAAAA